MQYIINTFFHLHIVNILFCAVISLFMTIVIFVIYRSTTEIDNWKKSFSCLNYIMSILFTCMLWQHAIIQCRLWSTILLKLHNHVWSSFFTSTGYHYWRDAQLSHLVNNLCTIKFFNLFVNYNVLPNKTKYVKLRFYYLFLIITLIHLKLHTYISIAHHSQNSRIQIV